MFFLSFFLSASGYDNDGEEGNDEEKEVEGRNRDEVEYQYEQEEEYEEDAEREMHNDIGVDEHDRKGLISAGHDEGEDGAEIDSSRAPGRERRMSF